MNKVRADTEVRIFNIRVQAPSAAHVAGHVHRHVHDPTRCDDRDRRPAVHPARSAGQLRRPGVGDQRLRPQPGHADPGQRGAGRSLTGGGGSSWAAIVIFAIGSAACALSPDAIVLVALPGAAGRRRGAAMLALTLSIITDDVPARDAGRAPSAPGRPSAGPASASARPRAGSSSASPAGPRSSGSTFRSRSSRSRSPRWRFGPSRNPRASRLDLAGAAASAARPVRGHPRADRVGRTPLGLAAVVGADRRGRGLPRGLRSGGSADCAHADDPADAAARPQLRLRRGRVPHQLHGLQRRPVLRDAAVPGRRTAGRRSEPACRGCS